MNAQLQPIGHKPAAAGGNDAAKAMQVFALLNVDGEPLIGDNRGPKEGLEYLQRTFELKPPDLINLAKVIKHEIKQRHISPGADGRIHLTSSQVGESAKLAKKYGTQDRHNDVERRPVRPTAPDQAKSAPPEIPINKQELGFNRTEIGPVTPEKVLPYSQVGKLEEICAYILGTIEGLEAAPELAPGINSERKAGLLASSG